MLYSNTLLYKPSNFKVYIAVDLVAFVETV